MTLGCGATQEASEVLTVNQFTELGANFAMTANRVKYTLPFKLQPLEFMPI